MRGPASPLASLLALAWPVVVARSMQAVIGFCDALMTAPLGEDAIAAVTSGSMNVFVLTILPMGLVLILQSFASQLSAKGEDRALWRHVYYGLLIAVVAGSLAATVRPAVPTLLRYLPHEEAVRVPMGAYIDIRLLAVGGVVGIEAIGNWYGGRKNTKLHMRVNLLAMALNVALNGILIEGHFGAPALGVEGAAIASVAATYVALGYAMVYLLRDRTRPPKMGPLRGGELWRVVRFGLPNGLNWFLEFAALLVLIDVVIAQLGAVPLASMMVVNSINAISFMPAFGLASAGAILCGRAIGSDDRDAVPGLVVLTIRIVAVWQVLVGICYFALSTQLVALFTPPHDRGMMPLAAAMLRIAVAWQMFDAIGMVVGEALRAAGDTAWTMWVRLGVAWLVFVPLSFVVLELSNGDPLAVLAPVVVYLGTLAVMFTLRLRGGAWRTIELT